MVDLFHPRIKPDRCHPQFISLADSDAHTGARRLINKAYAEMGDPNGNFVRDFQTHGFHGRLFELSCYNYLRSAGFEINARPERPDFIASRGSRAVAIEVTTANPPDGADPDISIARMQEMTDEEVHARAESTFPKRMMASLKKKLQHRYQDVPEVSGKPMVLMVAPCFEPAPGIYIDESLLPILYPFDDAPPGTTFFEREGAEEISAIAYTNAFTVSRYWRLWKTEHLGNRYAAVREGVSLLEDDPSLFNFRHLVGHASTPTELWSEGVTLFFNPFARTPLPEDLLPASSKFVLEDNELVRHVEGFHPLTSFMRMSSDTP